MAAAAVSDPGIGINVMIYVAFLWSSQAEAEDDSESSVAVSRTHASSLTSPMGIVFHVID